MKKIICLVLSLLMISSTTSIALADENEKYVYRNNTYDFKLITTDPMFISDEDFFGTFDRQGNEVIPSYFRYDEFPGMAAVKAAAMEGDYDGAKEALYEYYLGQKKDKVSVATTLSDTDLIQAEMQARNIYSATTGGMPIQITEPVGTEWTDVVVNSRILQAYIGNITKTDTVEFGIVVASTDKSNTAFEIKSRETDTPPTLQLVVNNVQKTYVAVADSYISPVRNAETNYGSETTLYAQEYAYESHWAGPDKYWPEEASETKRTYFKFILSDVKATDTISSATLTFRGRTSPDGDLDEKELFIYGWSNTDWEENNLKWNTFSDWLFVTFNDFEVWDHIAPSDTTLKGKICFYHRGDFLLRVANIYDYTGDERYAYTTMRNIMSMVHNVSNRADVMNQLDLSNHVRAAGNAFMKCWGSECMTAEMFTACLKHFYLVEEASLKILDKGLLVDNVATNMTASTYYMAMKYPEFKRADHWYERTIYHNNRIYSASVFADGVSVEQSINYVNTFYSTINDAIVVRDETKKGYYGNFCDDTGMDILLNNVKTWYYSLAPGYYSHEFGDAANFGTNYRDSIVAWYNRFKKMGIDDPELEYVATNGISGVLPAFTSVSFPSAKRTFMRSDWSTDATYLGITAKGDSASHGHHDVLNLYLEAYGQELITDPGYGAALTGDIFDYMTHAEQHNVITVNGGNISILRGQDGVEKEMELNSLYNMATYSHAYVDNASNTERTVLYLKIPNFFIVSDYVQPADTGIVNTYTQFWHMIPTANISISDDGTNSFRSNFASGANVILTPVDSDSMSDIRFGETKYSPAAGKFIDNLKGVYERKSKGNVKYGTVIYPYRAGEERKVETTEVKTSITDEGASAFRITVEDEETQTKDTYFYYHLSDLSQKCDVTIGKYKTDATALLVQEDEKGNAVSFFIYDGSYVEQSNLKDKYLFKSNGGNVTLGVNINNGNISEISSENLDVSKLDDITVRTGFDVSYASFNGKRIIETKKEGTYIYFGDAPIVECTETTPEDSGEDDDFDDFVGGGSSSGSSGGSSGGAVAPKPEDTTKPEDTEKEDDVVEEKPLLKSPEYKDVRVSDWYYEYVKNLSESGIVSGDGTGYFNPDDNVTREQFLKMIIMAADIETDNGENTFSDISDDAWYKDYVLTAKKLGIVNGVSETEFGIGTNITRQDMAVMIERTVGKLGISAEKIHTSDFADMDEISDYAKDSVRFMKSVGLITGYENHYRPLDNLTRAEAAKVVSEFINYIKY